MKFANDIEEMVYLEYQEIDYTEFQEKIRYFERNRKAIATLSYELRLELSLEYVVSLFEVGEYYQYLKHVDKLLAIVIEENIFSVDGDDIYQELLYRKAASLYNIVDYYGADHILKELCKIDPENEIYRRTYMKNSVDCLRYQGQKMRAATIALFILTGTVIGIELLMIRPFHEELVSFTEALRNGLFGVAFGGILLQELRIRYQSWRSLRKLQN